MYSTPAALSCSTNSLPPLPSTVRIAVGAAAGAAAAPPWPSGAKFCATALAATVLMPNALKPDTSFRRDRPWSRYCLINSFTASSLDGVGGSAQNPVRSRHVGVHNPAEPGDPELRGNGSDFLRRPEAQNSRCVRIAPSGAAPLRGFAPGLPVRSLITAASNLIQSGVTMCS